MKTKTAKKPKLQKKSKAGLILSLVVLVSCGFGVFNYKWVAAKAVSMMPFGVERSIGLERVTKQGSIKIAGGSSAISAGGILFVYDDIRLTAYDKDAKSLWKKSFISSSPTIKEFNQDFIIADGSMGDVYIVGRSGGIKAKVLGLGEIDSLHTDKSTIGIISKKDKVFQIFDKGLKSIAKVELPSGNITSWNYSMNLKRVSTAVLSTTSKGLMSSIHQFDFEGRLQESVSVEDSAIYHIDYSNDILRAVSDKSIRTWKMPMGTVMWNKELDRTVANFDEGTDKSFILNYQGTGTEGLTGVFENGVIGVDKNGVEFCKVDSLEALPKIVKIMGRGAIMSYEKKIAFYSSKGKEVADMEVKGGLKDILVIDQGHIALVYKERVEVFECLIG